MKISNRELATVLAALRLWQAGLPLDFEGDAGRTGHFEEHAPLTPDEIDKLCERINCEVSSTEESEELYLCEVNYRTKSGCHTWHGYVNANSIDKALEKARAQIAKRRSTLKIDGGNASLITAYSTE